MSTGIHAIKQGDVLKVFRAARLAGMEIERYEIDRQGNVVVFRATARPPIPRVEKSKAGRQRSVECHLMASSPRCE